MRLLDTIRHSAAWRGTLLVLVVLALLAFGHYLTYLPWLPGNP